MLNRGTIFLGLMLTGTLAAAAWVSQDDGTDGVVAAPAVVRIRDAGGPGGVVMPVLRLERLVRAKPAGPAQDPFASKSWYVPPPPPPEEEVQQDTQPSAPPLPFSYMGRMVEEDGHEIVYLAQGGRALSVSAGDTIDGTYRLDSVSSSQLVLTYLPLDIKQTLNAGGESPSMGGAGAAQAVTVANLPMSPANLPLNAGGQP